MAVRILIFISELGLTDPLSQKAQVEHILFLDMEYFLGLFQPVAPWGTQRPHEYALSTIVNFDEAHHQLVQGPAFSCLLARSKDLCRLAQTTQKHMKRSTLQC